MGAAEREPYENKINNNENSRIVPKKYTSQGLSFDELDRKQKEEHQKIKIMELTIETMLQNVIDAGNLEKHLFYFISISYYVQTINGDIFPAELAMSKFSLRDGVIDTLHITINPGKLPVGMASEAMDRAAKTHQFPLPPDIDGERDYAVILEDMLKFTGSRYEKVIPPLFVDPGMKDEDYDATKLTFEKIISEAGKDQMLFRLYPVEQLVFRLHKKCLDGRSSEKPFISTFLAKDQMQRDPFMYSDLGCEFHRTKDISYHCCLSKVKRLGFQISRYCLDKRFPTIAGQHYPNDYIFYDNTESISSQHTDWESEISESFRNIDIRKSHIAVASTMSQAFSFTDLSSVQSKTEISTIGRSLIDYGSHLDEDEENAYAASKSLKSSSINKLESQEFNIGTEKSSSNMSFSEAITSGIGRRSVTSKSFSRGFKRN